MYKNIDVSVIITSSFEPKSVGAVLRTFLDKKINKIHGIYEVLIVSPDEPTWLAAKKIARTYRFSQISWVKDNYEGKPKALNMAFKEAKGSVLVLTDGDTKGISKNGVDYLLKHFKRNKVGGVTGQPISADSKKTFFGYLGHLHCAAADEFRRKQKKEGVILSGYLFAIRNLHINIPTVTLAEDAWISSYINSKGYSTVYEPKAKVRVKFPKNLKDWLKQKTRSLGGNVQKIKKTKVQVQRNFFQDLMMAFFPLRYASNFRELIWSSFLYPLRALLWLNILYKQLIKKDRINKKAWERIESTK